MTQTIAESAQKAKVTQSEIGIPEGEEPNNQPIEEAKEPDKDEKA